MPGSDARREIPSTATERADEAPTAVAQAQLPDQCAQLDEKNKDLAGLQRGFAAGARGRPCNPVLIAAPIDHQVPGFTRSVRGASRSGRRAGDRYRGQAIVRAVPIGRVLASKRTRSTSSGSTTDAIANLAGRRVSAQAPRGRERNHAGAGVGLPSTARMGAVERRSPPRWHGRRVSLAVGARPRGRFSARVNGIKLALTDDVRTHPDVEQLDLTGDALAESASPTADAWHVGRPSPAQTIQPGGRLIRAPSLCCLRLVILAGPADVRHQRRMV